MKEGIAVCHSVFLVIYMPHPETALVIIILRRLIFFFLFLIWNTIAAQD